MQAPTTVESGKIKIENDKIIGSGRAEYYGYQRSNLIHLIGDAANKIRAELIKSLVVKGNNKFNLIDYKEQNIDDRDKPYLVDYNFILNNYSIKADKDLYINLNLDKTLEKKIIEKDRVFPIELEHLTFYDNTYELEIPKTHSIKLIPKNLTIDNKLISATILYEQNSGSIILKSKIKLKQLRLNPSDFSLWNETIQQLKNSYNELIILTEK